MMMMMIIIVDFSSDDDEVQRVQQCSSERRNFTRGANEDTQRVDSEQKVQVHQWDVVSAD